MTVGRKAIFSRLSGSIKSSVLILCFCCKWILYYIIYIKIYIWIYLRSRLQCKRSPGNTNITWASCRNFWNLSTKVGRVGTWKYESVSQFGDFCKKKEGNFMTYKVDQKRKINYFTFFFSIKVVDLTLTCLFWIKVSPR